MEKGQDHSDHNSMAKLMRAYGIEPQDITSKATDITPYYWENPSFRYSTFLAHPEGPIAVEIQPTHQDAGAFFIGRVASAGYLIGETNIRRIEVPSHIPAVAITGSSPRFPDNLCVHELILFNEED